MYLLRGLTTAYVRESVPDLQDDIGQYIAVQFNAVVDLATANGSNIYANSWSGPPSSAFSPVNQSNALSALIGAIHLHNASDATVIPGAPTASGSVAPLPHKLPTKEIIIASVLGTVALIAGILGIWAIRRRSASLRTSPVSPFGIWNTLRQLSGKHSRETLDPPPMAAVRKNAPVPRRAAPTPRRTAPVVASGQNPGPPPSNFPTEELVRILNERLQSQSWDAEEAPPDYPV
ncbi:hypothetical protein K438DRAFT_1819084 [Mycena galopus ATCC 62051]|nr:hypothetical protein K438DRAFT_1819084 [Mycena galopus ATCC 62051]